jgi:hypothetical protein
VERHAAHLERVAMERYMGSRVAVKEHFDEPAAGAQHNVS